MTYLGIGQPVNTLGAVHIVVCEDVVGESSLLMKVDAGRAELDVVMGRACWPRGRRYTSLGFLLQALRLRLVSIGLAKAMLATAAETMRERKRIVSLVLNRVDKIKWS